MKILNLNVLFLLIILKLFFTETNQKKIHKQKSQNPKTTPTPIDISFQEYVIKFHKTYRNQAQKLRRRDIFTENMNKLSDSTQCRSSCGVTKFTDKTQQEINKLRGITQILEIPIQHNSFQNNQNNQDSTSQEGLFASKASLQSNAVKNDTLWPPTAFDWRDYQVITSVKDQGSCGDCWAFSTIAFFQSQLIRRNQAKSNIDLSEQFLLQCDSISNGCVGGNLFSSMDLSIEHGLPFESTFPYRPSFNYPGICLFGSIAAFYQSWRVTIQNLNDSKVVQYILQRPLNIPIKSNNWQNYAPNDVNRTFQCTQIKNSLKQLNHAVLLIGYTQDQWIVKNQWGDDWGVGGYMYITRQKKFNCGIGLQINTLNYQLPKIVIKQKDIKASNCNKTANETTNTSSVTNDTTNDKN